MRMLLGVKVISFMYYSLILYNFKFFNSRKIWVILKQNNKLIYYTNLMENIKKKKSQVLCRTLNFHHFCVLLLKPKTCHKSELVQDSSQRKDQTPNWESSSRQTDRLSWKAEGKLQKLKRHRHAIKQQSAGYKKDRNFSLACEMMISDSYMS